MWRTALFPPPTATIEPPAARPREQRAIAMNMEMDMDMDMDLSSFQRTEEIRRESENGSSFEGDSVVWMILVLWVSKLAMDG